MNFKQKQCWKHKHKSSKHDYGCTLELVEDHASLNIKKSMHCFMYEITFYLHVYIINKENHLTLEVWKPPRQFTESNEGNFTATTSDQRNVNKACLNKKLKYNDLLSSVGIYLPIVTSCNHECPTIHQLEQQCLRSSEIESWNQVWQMRSPKIIKEYLVFRLKCIIKQICQQFFFIRT